MNDRKFYLGLNHDNYQDRLLFNMQYFHSAEASAREYLRSMAFFGIYIPMASELQRKLQSAALHLKISTDFNIMTTGCEIYSLPVP